jgi:hypothetical protein
MSDDKESSNLGEYLHFRQYGFYLEGTSYGELRIYYRIIHMILRVGYRAEQEIMPYIEFYYMKELNRWTI